MQYTNPDIEYCLEEPSSIFKVLQTKDKEALARNHAILSVKKGDFIYKEGEKAKGVICLASGKYKIFRVGAGGREQILKFVRPLEITGLRNLFQATFWNDSAVALEDSVICIPDRNTLVNIIKHNPDFSLKIMKLFSDEYLSAQNRIISLTQKHVRARLAETLLMLSEIYGFEPDGNTINASLSRDDIAHHSNMTTSNAIRTLSNLATECKIELRRKKIRLLDIPALEMISKSG